MRFLSITLVWLTVLAARLLAEDPVVRAVSVRQRPGTHLVDITFTVEDSDSELLSVGFSATDNVSGEPVPMMTVQGSTLVSPGTTMRTWDAGADWPGRVSNDLSFEVTVSDDPTRYLVVDLSGGPDATAYPWTEGPLGDLHTNPRYRTDLLVLRRVPAGTFTMGSPVDELGRWTNDERERQHSVTLTRDFYVGLYEVTQAQWTAVMGERPSLYPEGCEERPAHTISWEEIRGGIWPPSDNVPAPAPAAGTFMGNLRARTGLPLDLPTAAQWEYACRAGTTTGFNSGVDPTALSYLDPDPGLDGYAWYKNSAPDSAVQPVGLLKPNLWGLYDMHGNAHEWCLD